jgi:hypothetical protein
MSLDELLADLNIHKPRIPRKDLYKNPTYLTLKRLHETGELEGIFTWIANRLTDFEIRISDTGKFLLGPDENLGILTPIVVIQMLRGDVKRQFPDLTNNVRSELCIQTLNHLIKVARRRMEEVEIGYSE